MTMQDLYIYTLVVVSLVALVSIGITYMIVKGVDGSIKDNMKKEYNQRSWHHHPNMLYLVINQGEQYERTRMASKDQSIQQGHVRRC